MIRVVLAAVLATALVGVSLPAAERAEADRNAALATDELAAVAETAEDLAAENDPVTSGTGAASTVIIVDPPSGVFAAGGSLIIGSKLRWVPKDGPEQSVETAVRLNTTEPIQIADQSRLRLSLLKGSDGEPTVSIERVHRGNGRAAAEG